MILRSLLVLAAALPLASCRPAYSPTGVVSLEPLPLRHPHDPPTSARGFSTKPTARRLVVLHASDGASALLGAPGGSVGGVARAATLLRTLQRRAGDEVVVVAGGDAIAQAPELGVEVEGMNAAVAA